MKIAALLPHVEIYGGVRRYLEIGNQFATRGHTFVLFTPDGESPDWLEFAGAVRPFTALGEEGFDIAFCSEYSVLPDFSILKARAKFFYFVLEGHKKEREVAGRDFHFLGSSEGICRRIERRYRVRCRRAPGGINPAIFHPFVSDSSPARAASGDDFKILSYGRIYKKRKGIRQVIRAAQNVHREFPGLRLIFFDSLVGADRRDPRPMIKTGVPHEFHLNLPQSRMSWLFSQADAFVSAERRAGWANTAAEAMACRLPVVCTRSGTEDFAIHEKTALVVPFAHPFFLRRQIRRLILEPGLRERLAASGHEKIKEFTWQALAARLEEIFATVLSASDSPS
jgi:glycosyltransferase involved in cell wall biosynthesis